MGVDKLRCEGQVELTRMKKGGQKATCANVLGQEWPICLRKNRRGHEGEAKSV